MNEFNEFKKYLVKVGCTPIKRENTRQVESFQLNKLVHISITSDERQGETGLVAVHVCLRKENFYLPLGDLWAIGSLNLIEKIDSLLNENGFGFNLALKACW
jgi:hypothetical protein